MKKLDHENIVKLHDLYTISESHIYMVFEYCSGGDLAKYLSKHKALPEVRVRYFMKQLANGLKFLRSKNIIHRDLKPQNLLLSNESDDPILKIADFGFARFIEPQSVADTLCGSPLYMAPEILKLQKYSIKTDLWSVGAIFFEMLTNSPPFPAKSQIELVRLVDSKKRIEFPPHISVSEECASLVRALLQQDPMKRISWEEFFLHPWLGLHDTISSLSNSQHFSQQEHQFMSLPVPISSRDSPNTVVASPPSNLDLPFATLRRTSPPEPLYRRQSISTTPPDNFLIGSPTPVGSPPVMGYSSARSRSGSELLSGSGIPIPKTRPFKEPVPQYSHSLPTTLPTTFQHSGSLSSMKAESFPPSANLNSSFGHDSFEIVSTESSLPDFSDEALYVSDIKQKTKRIKSVISLGELHQEMGKYTDAISLYLKCCELLESYIQTCKSSPLYKTSAELVHVVQGLRDIFEDLVKRCEVMSVWDKGAFVPYKLIYEAAMRNGKEGGVYESLKNYDKSEQYYTNGVLLLELLHSEAVDSNDKDVLKNFINSFSRRLSDVKLNKSRH